jgi:hypothetical protein
MNNPQADPNASSFEQNKSGKSNIDDSSSKLNGGDVSPTEPPPISPLKLLAMKIYEAKQEQARQKAA